MAAEGSESALRAPWTRRQSALQPGIEEERVTNLRFLISNNEAGFIIGNGGSTIDNITSQSGARIQLSRQHEYFPGTHSQIIMIVGTIDQISSAFDLIVSKLLDRFYSQDGGAAVAVTDSILIVPDVCCGAIIGRGGETIKSLSDVSGAHIRVQPKNMNHQDLCDRLVTVRGTKEQRFDALEQILQELENHPYYNPVYPYAAVWPNVENYGSYHGTRGMQQYNLHPNRVTRANMIQSVTIGIPDIRVGKLMGRGGCRINKISQDSGATIDVSGRGDFISGTSNRKVTIRGSESAIDAAKSMIDNLLN